MALILNIDTATEKGSIALAREGKTLAMLTNDAPKEHAAWLHTAVKRLLNETGTRMRDLAALAVTSGPGSYTGLRVGMAAAKGFCYALDIPLITEGTLKVMAFAAREQLTGTDLLCPVIDARRMEVFTAIYRSDMSEVLPANAMIIDEQSFERHLADHQMSFFGSGSDKCKPLIRSPHARFETIDYHAGYLGILSFLRYLQKEFTGLAYSEPAYTKEFYTHTGK